METTEWQPLTYKFLTILLCEAFSLCIMSAVSLLLDDILRRMSPWSTCLRVSLYLLYFSCQRVYTRWCWHGDSQRNTYLL